jgi:hypothetical protein
MKATALYCGKQLDRGAARWMAGIPDGVPAIWDGIKGTFVLFIQYSSRNFE